MAEFKLDRIRFRWKGAWSSGTAYIKDDIVSYGGYSYVAIQDNQASPPTNTTDWTLINKGISWEGQFDSNAVYKLGDVVSYTSSSYISVDSNHSGVVPGTDNTKWNLLAQGDANAVMTTHGDMIFRNATDVTRLPVGPQGTMLKSNGPGADLSWTHEEDNTWYVAGHGDDT